MIVGGHAHQDKIKNSDAANSFLSLIGCVSRGLLNRDKLWDDSRLSLRPVTMRDVRFDRGRRLRAGAEEHRPGTSSRQQGTGMWLSGGCVWHLSLFVLGWYK